MSEQQATTAVQERPAPDGYTAWPDYWTAQGMSWRTEPEIDEEQQRFLSERRAISPDIEKNVYPFKDIHLDRADVEWLLATDETRRGLAESEAGIRWEYKRKMDLRGADLKGADLRRLPLMALGGGLSSQEWVAADEVRREMAAIHLEGANLNRARLEGASLRFAHLEGADLRFTHLEAATVRGAHFGGADLRSAYVDKATVLSDMDLGDAKHGYAKVVDVHWGEVNLAVVQWSQTQRRFLRRRFEAIPLGDEQVAWKSKYEQATQEHKAGNKKDRTARRMEFDAAARANRQLATVLRSQGLNADADRFAYKAQVLERQVLRRQGRLYTSIGSWFLDLISGHGYKPTRAFMTYLFVVGAFAAAYALLAYLGLTAERFPSWDSFLVLSVTSFHGRVFFAGGLPLDDWVARVGAVEAVIGLLIEITFIATFTQRFFAR
jgi:uncharacterized protein YjbI with pentapeptide repeats